MRWLRCAAALVGVWAAALASADDVPLLIELPPGTQASALGAAGFMVVGGFVNVGGFYWTPLTGVVRLGGRGATAISRDGGTIAGTAFDSAGRQNAAIWVEDREWRLLGSFHPAAQSCDASLSSTFGASDDGRTIVGLAWDGCPYAHGFRWEESTGMVDLGSTVPNRASRANAVSGDGKVIVGWQEDATGFRQAVRWVDGKQELILGPRGPMGEAQNINRDGSIIVGETCDPYAAFRAAWKWTPAAGVECFPVERERPDPKYHATMLATSDDGRVIVGAHAFGVDSEAVVWFDGTPRFLTEYLRASGVPGAFSGWVNTGFLDDVSPDGRVLLGHGAGPTNFQAYVVILPEGAPVASRSASPAVR